MKLKNTLTEYGAISRIFHWLSATVLIIQIPLGMYLVDMDFSEKRLTIENIHVAVGISIFYLTVLRLIYKAFNPTPKLNNSIFPGQKIIAKLNHVFLYISILMITISGALKKLYNGEELDMFDAIVAYLIDEGFAESWEEAQDIMTTLKPELVEEVYQNQLKKLSK